MMSYQSYREKMFMISSINKIWCIYSLKKEGVVFYYNFSKIWDLDGGFRQVERKNHIMVAYKGFV